MNRVLSFKNISKEFSGVRVLHDINLDIYEGEVIALMGENGAGKSTLMKILSGIYTATSGDIFIDDENVRFSNSQEALEKGISMVHQELMPIMEMSVAENIFVGREIRRGNSPLVSQKDMISEAKKIFDDLGVDINPKKKMKELSIAARQMVEIARAVSRKSKIIIMDEPTSAISERECELLFGQIKRLKEEKISIIFISHKMDEIYKICDRIAVLRDGRIVGVDKTVNFTQNQLISLMVGRELTTIFPASKSQIGEEILQVNNLNLPGILKNINFSLKRGEVFGIAGLMGSGRTEIVESIYGLRKKASCTVMKNGSQIKINHPGDAIKNGIALIPEDRKLSGLNVIGNVKENTTVISLNNYLARFGFIRKKKEVEVTNEQIDRLHIKTTGYQQVVKFLSGGNQQKIVFARWLITDCDIFFMDDPTRGIDVNAKAEMYSIIRELTAQGKSVVLISSELPEIIGLCDRVMVLSEGEKQGELLREELTQEKIMRMASGL